MITDYLAREFPQVRVTRLEGTYLLWIDFRGLGIECHELARILKEEAHIFLDEALSSERPGRASSAGIWLRPHPIFKPRCPGWTCLKKHLSGMKREML